MGGGIWVAVRVEVATSGSAEERKERTALLNEAVSQGELLLKRTRDDVDTDFFEESLALALVDLMQDGQVEDKRPQWRQDGTMNAFARALAFWSLPDVVTADVGTAKAMFLMCTDVPPRRGQSSLALLRAVNLLDAAFAAAVRTKSTAVMASLQVTWDAAIVEGRIRANGAYARSFELLSRAAESEEGRVLLSKHPSWKSSRSVRALTAPASAITNSSSGGSA